MGWSCIGVVSFNFYYDLLTFFKQYSGVFIVIKVSVQMDGYSLMWEFGKPKGWADEAERLIVSGCVG